ncbi:hypothetical protein AgCh_022890 [Apium graveolens]
MTSQTPKNWATWLVAAEWWYNTTFHTILNTSPYQVVYGVRPRHIALVDRVCTNLSSLEDMLIDKQQQWTLLKELLEKAQLRMKSFADNKRSKRVFEVGDLVYLKLQPYRQVTVVIKKNFKLSVRYFGTYKILEKIG